MTERFVTFACHADRLLGVLHVPGENARRLGVLVIVGGPQYRVGSHRQFVLMARALACNGYPVLRFDCRGMGDSTGEHRNFDEIESDAHAAIDAFHAEFPALEGVVVFGLCDAASAALLYCAGDRRVRGIVLVNPWVRDQVSEARVYLKHYYVRRFIQRSFWKKVVSGDFAVWESLRNFLGSVSKANFVARDARSRVGFVDRMQAGLAAYSAPVLLLMSGQDLVAREFDDLCRSRPDWSAVVGASNVRRVDLPDADHTFSSAVALTSATAEIIGWLDQWCTQLHAD